MKIQIWKSQFETFSLLYEDRQAATQLNMGEGKTQVIIPMIVLEVLLEKGNATPRINCLFSLYNETYCNFYKFLSATELIEVGVSLVV